jgi:hypothetical protein
MEKGFLSRQRASVGRGAPQILVRCPQDVFDHLHQLAANKNKSLNLTAIEVFKLGLAASQNGNAKSPTWIGRQ